MNTSGGVNVDSEENNPRQSWDILADHQGIKIKEKFILKVSEETKNVNMEVKNSCKVLHFSSKWKFDDVLATIDGLDSKEYPQLFIIIIETNFKFSAKKSNIFSTNLKKLQTNLLKFDVSRQQILQLTSNDKNKTTKIYFKDKIVGQFTEIEHQQGKYKGQNAFRLLLCSFLNHSFNAFENDVIANLPQLQNRSLMLRFLRILNLSDRFFERMILEIAGKGSISEFLAALDAPFGIKKEVFVKGAFPHISRVFSENDDSVLLTAIENKNTNVTDDLICRWTHLIQQLPFEHQVKISTAAFETKQLDVLRDLLEIADYPFPQNFKPETIEHESLKTIIKERADLEAAIKHNNIHEIKSFIDEKRKLKIAYHINNKSALQQAVDASNFEIYKILKNGEFRSINPNEKLEEAEEKVSKYAIKQRMKNVNEGLTDDQWSVNSLCNKSIIHNKRIRKEQEKEYRKMIRKWYEDIHKVNYGQEFLNVAASCDRLKIIFDFESDTVENVSLEDPNAAGSMDPSSKWIFVGAKLAYINDKVTKQSEQNIKGALAHELCHYVMYLVYDNRQKPYYKDREDMKEMFEEIVKNVNGQKKWSLKDAKGPDDECNGIISSVFKLYLRKEIHPELIVRVVQILVVFDNDEDCLKKLQKKYKALFDFWEGQVIPELRNYILRNKEVIKLNRLTRLLHNIINDQIEINPGKDINKLIDSKLVIVTTNYPKLLLIDICKNLKNKFGNLMDSKNLLIELENLNNPEIWDEFKQICSDNQELSIFIDCTKGTSESLDNIFINKELNFNFLVLNKSKSNELKKYCITKGMKDSLEMEINLNWSDLTEESQHLLLQTKISFQNDSKISLKDLLNIENTGGTEDHDLAQIIDDHALNFLVEKKEILINTNLENFTNEEKLIYQARTFRKKHKHNKENFPEISQEELLSEVKNQQYVLISDQAGNGKSWAMKNFTNILREQNPTSWVTHVDLKQFIDEFKAQEGEPEFSTFMIENILKPQHKFEVKIFQKLYKNGKVFILFDGFDEIAPDCAEFVSKLVQNFKSNGGNQLWIATRDYFEVDLMEKLKLDYAYGLHEMTENEGIELITRSWVFMDFVANKNVPNSRVEFDEVIKSSTAYKNYQLKALELVKKVTINWNRSIGLPLLFKLIAGLKNEKNVERLKKSEIFDKFIRNLYIRWSDNKGPIRKVASVDSQQFELNFYKFHQFHAILSLFPKLAPILFPENDGSKWKNEEIIACGILTIKDGKIYFIHETFREYFVADFITIGLKISKIDEKVFEIFAEILTVEKFGVIRMFLNDMIDNVSILTKIQLKVQNHVAKFNKMTSFDDFFTSNLKNLVDLVFGVLKTGDYEQVLGILWKNVFSIAIRTKNSEIFQKLQEFIFGYLKVNDLKKLIIEQRVLHGIIESSLEIEMFEDFVIKMEKMEAKTDQEFIREALMSGYGPNIFYYLSTSSYINVHKVQKVLEIMEKYLTVDEVFKLMSNCGDGSVLKTCVREGNKEKLKILWTEIENYFTSRKIHQKFKELVKQHKRFNENILHCFLDYADGDDSIDFYKTLWELLLKTFEDREELKDIVLQKDDKSENFVYNLVSRIINQEIFEWTIKILQENFTNTQLQEILQFKVRNKMILLKYAARSSSSEVIKILWNIFQDLCGTKKKFLKMLNEVAGNGQNIFHMVVSHSSSEVFEFMIQELEKIASPDKIKEILKRPNGRNRNLLQLAARRNRSLELHKSLWKTIREYCEESEITHFITNVDTFESNLLFNVVRWNTKEIIELTWNEIKKNLNHDEQVQYLKLKGEGGLNLIQCSYRNWIHKNEVTEWVMNLFNEYGIE